MTTLTERMKKLLNMAAGTNGLAQGYMTDEYFEASRNGWIEYAGRPQNSMTSRYRITEQGRAALADPT